MIWVIIKIISGTILNVSLEALQVLTGELPLNLRRKLFNDKFNYFLQFSTFNHPTRAILGYTTNNPQWKAGEGPFVLRSCNDIINIEKQDNLLPFIPEWHLLRPNISSNNHKKIHKREMLGAEMKSIILDMIGITYKGYLHVYTDGSKLENGKTGAAFYIPQYQVTKHYRLSNVCIMRAELIAILMSIEWIESCVKSSSVVIFCDSLSALQMIKSYFIRCSIVNEILTKIHYLTFKDISISFEWMPSHCDIHGNDTVDKAAKKGAIKEEIDINMPNTVNELSSSRLIFYTKKWQAEWDSSEKGRFLYTLYPNVTEQVYIKNISRREECLLQQLRVGKCKLNFYLFEIKQHESGLCPGCKVFETIEHFLLNCSSFIRQRNTLLQKTKLHNPSIKQLLTDPSYTRELLQYIHATKRFECPSLSN